MMLLDSLVPRIFSLQIYPWAACCTVYNFLSLPTAITCLALSGRATYQQLRSFSFFLCVDRCCLSSIYVIQRMTRATKKTLLIDTKDLIMDGKESVNLCSCIHHNVNILYNNYVMIDILKTYARHTDESVGTAPVPSWILLEAARECTVD